MTRCVGKREGDIKKIHGGGNEEVKDAISRKKEAHKAMFQNST